MILPCLISSPIRSTSRDSGHCLEWRLAHLLAPPPKGDLSQVQPRTLNLPSNRTAELNLLSGLIILKTRFVGSNACTPSQSLELLTPKQVPSSFCSSSLALPEAGAGVGEAAEFASSVLRQGDSRATLRLAWPGLVGACSCSPPSGVRPVGVLSLSSLAVGQCGLNPARQGVRLGCSPTVPHYVFLHCFLCKLS